MRLLQQEATRSCAAGRLLPTGRWRKRWQAVLGRDGGNATAGGRGRRGPDGHDRLRRAGRRRHVRRCLGRRSCLEAWPRSRIWDWGRGHLDDRRDWRGILGGHEQWSDRREGRGGQLAGGGDSSYGEKNEYNQDDERSVRRKCRRGSEHSHELTHKGRSGYASRQNFPGTSSDSATAAGRPGAASSSRSRPGRCNDRSGPERLGQARSGQECSWPRCRPWAGSGAWPRARRS